MTTIYATPTEHAPAANYLAGMYSAKNLQYQAACIDRACSMYYVMIGGLYNAVNTQMRDAHDELAKHPKVYRQQVKRDTREALRCYDRWNTSMRTTLKDRYNLWLDVSDKIDETLHPHIWKMTMAMEQYLLKMNEPDAHLKAMLQCASTLAEMTKNTITKYFGQIQQRIGIDIKPMFAHGLGEDIYKWWERGTGPILRTGRKNVIIDFNDDANCRMAARVLAVQIADENLYNNAGDYALRLNPDQWKPLEKEDRMRLKKGLPIEQMEPTGLDINLKQLQDKYNGHD